MNECLLNQAHTDRFVDLIKEIVAMRELNEPSFVEDRPSDAKQNEFQNDINGARIKIPKD